MKKILIITLMLFALTACGTNHEEIFTNAMTNMNNQTNYSMELTKEVEDEKAVVRTYLFDEGEIVVSTLGIPFYFVRLNSLHYQLTLLEDQYYAIDITGNEIYKPIIFEEEETFDFSDFTFVDEYYELIEPNDEYLELKFKIEEEIITEIVYKTDIDGEITEATIKVYDLETTQIEFPDYLFYAGEDIDIKNLPYYTYLNDQNPVVSMIVTGYGLMQLQLFPDVAKNTVDNFIAYIEEGSYVGSTFHRIIEDFMIQGGIVDQTTCPIKGEFSANGVVNNLPHFRGVISMARTNVKNSATSQFFIVHESSGHLDGNYAGFGALTSGFDVLDKIASVRTATSDQPIASVVIEQISVKLNGYIPNDVVCGG